MSVRKLRTVTGMPVVLCASAWKESQENWDQAIEILKQKGMDKSAKLNDRTAESIFIGSYIHHDGKCAGMVKMCTETDFVSNTPEFHRLANDIAMHVAVCDSTENLESQLFVVQEKVTIGEMIKEMSAKTGEKITIEFVVKV